MLNADQARIRSFEVVPRLPEPLRPLLTVAYNLWWTWHPEAFELFVRLDHELWEQTNHNPVAMLGACSQDVLNRAAVDEGFLTSMSRVQENLARHLERTPWHERGDLLPDASDRKLPAAGAGKFTIAYFCAEFGLTECLRIYSGGLGCLAGDHLKSASELGLPLVAVGLLYRNGYFQQYLNADGWQQEYARDLDLVNLPVSRVIDAQGAQTKVQVDLTGRTVHVAIWKVLVGRIKLYLLDTNLPENDPADRGITSQLYGGDMEMRIKQEIVLGIGGVRALDALGIEPDVCHMNEGHSAFLALERIRRLIQRYGVTFDEARQSAAASHVFTTHTPVPAGIDRFPPEMIHRYFKHYHDDLKLDMEGLLALRTADWANGVSKLHGQVSRGMWKAIWPGIPEAEVPITHVTNGVHARSWMSRDLIQMLDRYLGARRWQDDPSDHTVWDAIKDVPDEELWRIHDMRRQRLIIWARKRLRAQLEARGVNPEQVGKQVDSIDPGALTIGFARRFATYKRGTLLLRDPERFKAMLANTDRPIQFIIAGKAHPADGGGKELIRQIVHFASEAKGASRIVFIENYDINVARYLVQGCDVWLNTPRRGMEASGTSGMKAALNGVLNCSILDGWWDEAYQSDLGWAIGGGESYANVELQDQIENAALYDLLQEQIIPMFYDRDSHGVPRQWVHWMKNCISQLAPMFNTNRMVQEYAEQLYLPALARARELSENDLQKGIELAHFKGRLRGVWDRIAVEDVQADSAGPLQVRTDLELTVVANLAELEPQEVCVQVYSGPMDHDRRITVGRTYVLEHRKSLGEGRHQFAGSIPTDTSGRFGFAVRIIPGGMVYDGLREPGLLRWEAVADASVTVKREPEPAKG
jgi:starch phosphorylase